MTTTQQDNGRGNWLPIETAPKDGTRILGADREITSVTYSSWGRDWKCEAEVTDDGHGWSGHGNWHPTHWQPLPSPPEVKS